MLLYAVEYFDLYCLFAFKSEAPYEGDKQTAVSYLEGALECVEDARAAILVRSSKPS